MIKWIKKDMGIKDIPNLVNEGDDLLEEDPPVSYGIFSGASRAAVGTFMLIINTFLFIF